MMGNVQQVDDMRDEIIKATAFVKNFSNPNRMLILSSLVSGERSVAELEASLDIHQPTLSQQLGELRDAGLIVGRREVKSVYYKISDRRVYTLITTIHGLFCNPSRSDPAASRPSPGGQAAVFGRVLAPEQVPDN